MLYLRFIYQILVLCICIPAWIKAQYTNFPLSANSAGMAGISVTYPGKWAVFNNQAGMTEINSFHAGVHYENHFLVTENSIKAFSACLPVSGGNMGFSFALFGYDKFYECRAGLAFGKSFGKIVSGGIQINYLMIHQAFDYGNMYAVIPEGGLLTMPARNLYIGFHIFNPAGQRFLQYQNQQIPVRLKTGIGYHITDNVFFAFEAEKATGEKFNIKAGSEYMIVKKIVLRMGASTSDISKYALGIGYQFKTLYIDFAISHHQWLGFTPYLSLVYSSGGN
jgi:hypothetical protein